MSHLLEKCVCGTVGEETGQHNGLPILRCKHCGIMRQYVEMTEEQLGDWYREQYYTRPEPHVGVSHEKAYAHDRDVANLRLQAYRIPADAKMLDVGAGNGAFVHAARKTGYDAWGTDLSKQSEDDFIYVGKLKDIGFPTESFDVVTFHDVLEHLLRPTDVLREVRRILKPDGTLIVDFPRFFHESGRHHWRPIQHLWFLDEAQLQALLTEAGFIVQRVEHPIPSKVVLYATRERDKRVRIIVPSGIGDAYWCLVKLPGFLRAKGLGMPDVWVISTRLNRTQPFLELVPWLHAPGYRSQPSIHYGEAYLQDGRSEFANPVHDMEWFIAYNGVLRHERRLEDVNPEYGVEWRPKFHFSKAALKIEREQKALGPYVAVFFTNNELYTGWWREFALTQVEETLKKIPYRIVLLGARWDIGKAGDDMAKRHPEWTNLINKTTVAELLGVLRGATAVFGQPAGNTLIAPALNTPTVLIWNQYFKPGFWANAVAPDTPYRALDSNHLTSETVLRSLREVIDEKAANATE